MKKRGEVIRKHTEREREKQLKFTGKFIIHWNVQFISYQYYILITHIDRL